MRKVNHIAFDTSNKIHTFFISKFFFSTQLQCRLTFK